MNSEIVKLFKINLMESIKRNSLLTPTQAQDMSQSEVNPDDISQYEVPTTTAATSFSSEPPKGIPNPPGDGPWRFFIFNGLLVAQVINGGNRIDYYWNSTGNPPQWVTAPGIGPGSGD
jgi:hypothetical protein